MNDSVIKEPIIDEHKRSLTPKAHEIFSEWFDKYMDPEKEKMTPESAVNYILGATTEFCTTDDKRIKDLFSNYAKNDESGETLERDEFLKFCYMSAKDDAASMYK